MKTLLRTILYFAAVISFNTAMAGVSFEKIWIEVGAKRILVEVADTPEKAAQGLMFRKNLPENQGMLFVFPEEQVLSFWMKNTFIDLSIAYITKQKTIGSIKSMKAAKSEMQSHFETYESDQPAQYALEMGLGWFHRNNIKVGDKVKILIKK